MQKHLAHKESKLSWLLYRVGHVRYGSNDLIYISLSNAVDPSFLVVCSTRHIERTLTLFILGISDLLQYILSNSIILLRTDYVRATNFISK